MSVNEFARWQDYLATGTHLERLLDTHLAQIASLLFNSNRGKNTRVRKVKEFLLLPQPKPDSDAAGDRMLAKMKAMVLASGGEIIDKRATKD